MSNMRTALIKGFLELTSKSPIKGMKDAGNTIAEKIERTTRTSATAEYYYNNIKGFIDIENYEGVLSHDLLHHARTSIAHNVLGYNESKEDEEVIMVVDLDYILAVKKRFRQINTEDIKNIEWLKDGKPVKFTKEDLEEFELMGLNNTDINTVFGFTPK